MNLVDQAFLRWQRIHQPRRFRESLVAAGEQLVCALTLEDRGESAATTIRAPGSDDAASRAAGAPTRS